MLYRELRSQHLSLNSNETRYFNAADGYVMIPDQCIEIHWLTNSGNIRATYTMSDPIEIRGNVTLINNNETTTNIHVVKLI